MESKYCKACHSIKEIVEFTKDKHLTSGYSSRCKKCQNELYQVKYEKKKIKKIENQIIDDLEHQINAQEIINNIEE